MSVAVEQTTVRGRVRLGRSHAWTQPSFGLHSTCVLTAAGFTFKVVIAIGVLSASHAKLGGVIAAGVFTALAALGIRLSNSAVIVRGDELVVRNCLTTHHVPPVTYADSIGGGPACRAALARSRPVGCGGGVGG